MILQHEFEGERTSLDPELWAVRYTYIIRKRRFAGEWRSGPTFAVAHAAARANARKRLKREWDSEALLRDSVEVEITKTRDED